MNYKLNKEARKQKAQIWSKKMNDLYSEQIKNSVNNSTIYPISLSTNINSDNNKNTSIDIRGDLDTVSAIFEYKRRFKNICLLNFASYKNPGGGFLNGATAQEECLCMESNLYNILINFKDFYEPNQKRYNKGLYNSNLIYTPDVLFFKNNRSANSDVITCAAPNKKVATEKYGLSDKVVYKAMEERIDHILYSAYENKIDCLILGAFGCGIFGNNPKDVAEIFKKLLDKKYTGVFIKVVFAIPNNNSKNNNYKEFYKVFKNINK